MKRNRVYCLQCHELIESTSQHDWVQCSCANVFVDGGTTYWRMGCRDVQDYIRVLDAAVSLMHIQLVEAVHSKQYVKEFFSEEIVS